MDLYLALGDQRHAVRLLQLFYLQHSRAGATFPSYDDLDDEEGDKPAAPTGGRRRGRGRGRRRRRGDDDGDGDEAQPPPPPPRPKAPERVPKADDDPRAAADPFFRMVGDTSALDGRVRIFPGVEEEEEEEEAESGEGGEGGEGNPRRRRRLVFARAAVEMGPCSNRHGPASLFFSGVTIPPLVVIAWLKRSFVGRHVQRAFFLPRSGAGAQAPKTEKEGQAASSPTAAAAARRCCWGGMARTAEQAAADGWAQAAACVSSSGLDGVRVACSDRRLQGEVLAALEGRGEGQGAAAAAAEGGEGGGQASSSPPHPLRLDPTASATHALCVARVAVADLRAAGTPLSPAGDDGAADPAVAERASALRRALDAKRGMARASEEAEAAALSAPHRYVWSLAPVAWLYRLAWDEPATHGSGGGGGQAGGGGGGGAAGAGAAGGAACAHAVHKLDEALRVLGLARDGDGADDGRAARSDVTAEERAAWEAYVSRGASGGEGGAAPEGPPPPRLLLRRALDVGAAPGSWTALMARRILLLLEEEAKEGAEAAAGAATATAAAAATAAKPPGLVVAVDPADLDPSCLALPVVRHLRVAAGTDEADRQIRKALAAGGTTAATAAATATPPTPTTTPPEQQVDLLTCDANTHPKDTLEKLVLPLLRCGVLRPGGFLVVTLKLHGTGRWRGRISADCDRILSQGEAGTLPGAALWLLANTNHERTYVARMAGGREEGEYM